MARAVAPHMRAAGWGRIVNVSMGHETMRRPGFSPRRLIRASGKRRDQN